MKLIDHHDWKSNPVVTLDGQCNKKGIFLVFKKQDILMGRTPVQSAESI